MGKLSISRGRERDEAQAAPPRLSIVARGQPAAPLPTPAISSIYQPVHDRLTALERLARLHGQGVLSDAEFAAEKALILERHPDELVLNEPLVAADHAPGPSLFGRLFGWRLLSVGLLAGVALSLASQPEETSRFFTDALSLFGA